MVPIECNQSSRHYLDKKELTGFTTHNVDQSVRFSDKQFRDLFDSTRFAEKVALHQVTIMLL